MSKQSTCHACHRSHLLRIGVPGIRKCAHCGAFVDLRRKGWLQRLISA